MADGSRPPAAYPRRGELKLVVRWFLGLLALVVCAPSAFAGTTVVNEAGRLVIVGDDGPNDVSIAFSEGSSAYAVTVLVPFEELADPVLREISPKPKTYSPTGSPPEVITMTYSGGGDTGEVALTPVDLALSADPAQRVSTSGCEAGDFTGFPSGHIALMQRGGCPYAQKATNAQAAGAVGAIIFNSGTPGNEGVIAGTLDETAQDGQPVPPDVTIPVVGISYGEGVRLANELDPTIGQIIVTAESGGVRIDGSTGCGTLSPGRLSCPRNAVGGSFQIDAARGAPDENKGLFGGDDSLRVGYGSDDVHPGDHVLVALGPGDDFFGGSRMRDVAFGQEGNDLLDGAEGNDDLFGGSGFSPGSDQVFGGPGSDRLTDGDSTPGGPDVVDGGACFGAAVAHSSCPASQLAEASGDLDLITYGRTGDVTLDLADGAASQGESGEGDIVRNVEHANTGHGDDTVTGNAAGNIINTGGGNDTVNVFDDPPRGDLVACGSGTDTATGDPFDVFKHELGEHSGSAGICETVTRIETRTGGVGSAGGGSPVTGAVPRGGGPPTADRALASVARELPGAARALERCGITALLKKRGCRDSFTALGPGAVRYRVTAPAARANASAAAVIARATRVIPAAGSYPVRVKATKKGRMRLRKARKLRATLTVTFTDSRGNVAKRSKKIVLKRRKK
jgi:hypothetical protein